jgi:acetyl-CoA synthetase
MEVISAFVVLKRGFEPSDELRRELIETVRHELGPIAVIGDLNFVSMLPKTRSGKIMRRLLRDVAEGRELGDTSTLVDPTVFEAIRASK